jgi:outer membrane biosynthesis protein TonB
MKKALVFSIIIHGILLIVMGVDYIVGFKKNVSSPPMIIDFVEIGNHSKAPKLGPNSRSTKVKNDKKETKKEEKKDLSPPKQEKIKDIPSVKEKDEPAQKKEFPKKDSLIAPLEKKPKILPKSKKEADKSKKMPDSLKKTEQKAQVNLKDSKIDSKGEKNGKKAVAVDDLFDEIAGEGVNAEEVGPVLTGSEIDAMRRKIYECWNIPAGAKDAENLVIDIEIYLTKDGMVEKAQISKECQRRSQKDGFFKIAAESALRAVLDPRCQPFPLPKEKYNLWKEIIMTFNPKDMFR